MRSPPFFSRAYIGRWVGLAGLGLSFAESAKVVVCDLVAGRPDVDVVVVV